MVFLRKRSIVLAAGLAVLAGVLFAGPALVARIITSNLDLPAMKQLVVDGVKSQTNLHLNIQGSRFDLYQGIIFSGIHGSLEDEKGRSHFLIESENAVLSISYWKLLTGEFPVDELVIHQGRLDPLVLDRFRWKGEPEHETETQAAATASAPAAPLLRPGQGGWNEVAAGKLPDDLDFRAAARRIGVRIVEVDLILPEDRAHPRPDRAAHFLQLNLNARPAAPRPGYDLNLEIRAPRKSEVTGQLRLRGRWIPAAQRKELEVLFEDVSAGLLRSLLMVYPVLPDDLADTLERWNLKNGLIQGAGSVEFGAETTLLKIAGDYSELELNILSREQAGLVLADAAGTFRGEARFPGIAEPEALSFEADQTGLHLKIDYAEENDPEVKRRNRKRKLDLEGSLKFAEEHEELRAFLLGSPVYGSIELRADAVYEAGDDIVPNFDLSCTDLDLRLPPIFERAVERAAGRPPRILVRAGQATQKDEELSLQAQGDLLGFPFQLFGEGSLRFDMISFRDRRVRDITQDLDLDVTVREVEYGDLAGIVGRLYRNIMAQGTARNAPKAEDGGPLFKLSFDRRFLYRGLLKPLKFNADITLKKKQVPGEIMPDELEIEIYKQHGQAEFKIPTQRSDRAKIYYRYQLSFYNNLPRHEQSFELYIKNNTYALPEIFGSERPPEYLEMYYAYKGDGWFPYDLIHWSHSNMRVYMENLYLGQAAPFHIIRHSLSLPEEDLAVDELRFERITSGREVDFRGIRLKSKTLDMSGSGSFDLPGDGGLKFSYDYQPDPDGDEIEGRLRLKQTDGGKWIPATD